MMTDNICGRCYSRDLRRSRIHNIFEWLLSFSMRPYRCRECDHREMKLNSVKVQRPTYANPSRTPEKTNPSNASAPAAPREVIPE